MSELNAKYTFLSYLRQGIATAIKSPKADATRAMVPMTLVFNEKQTPLKSTAELFMVGPGDITGLDPRAVVRTMPPPGAMDAQPHLFPCLEIDQPDLPWRYTPEAADELGRLNPWLCLIVLAEGEYNTGLPKVADGLPVIKVEPTAPLPDLEQAWAWAHVQVSGPEPADPNACAELMRSHPERLLARLMCPRHLLARQTYTAFLVPVYERGRLAGLGGEVTGSATALAWDVAKRGDRALELPVYYQWQFGTGAKGDFEYLVTKLQARPLPPGVGHRPLNVQQPGAGLPAASGDVMGLEASLGSPAFQSTEWPEQERANFVERLQGVVNEPEDALRSQTAGRKVAPPLYGRWHAACRRLKATGPPAWFHELNADPRLRVAAAMGTQVVRQQQEQLMTSAWRQLEGIEAINAELKQAQVAREAARRIYKRDLVGADEDTQFLLTGPVHSQVAHGTVTRELQASPIPDGVFEPHFRRIAQRLGRKRRQQGPISITPPSSMLRRMNSGELAADRPPVTPTYLVTVNRVVPDGSAESLKKLLPSPGPGPDVTPERGDDNAFEWAVRNLLTVFGKTPAEVPARTPANLERNREKIVAELDPDVTVEASYRRRLRFPGQPEWKCEDWLEPIMAAPEFPQPMFKPLAERSQDWILPGLDRVLANSLTLAVSNQAFIEAYMVGLNHEMARELLWREYPTDQRGSYFCQFWDPSGFVAADGDPLTEADLKDIKPIHTWAKAASLGDNRPHSPVTGDLLILVVRGELLKRYPNTVVYAVKATEPSGDPKRHGLGTTERHPVFSGHLEPDVAFFGFELTEPQARGSSDEWGWFFVLQEQPSEPGFGLDVADGPAGEQEVDQWDNLSWGHLAAGPEEWDHLAYIDLAATAPITAAAEDQPDEKAAWHDKAGSHGRAADSAALAYITLQKPVRIAIHGSDMLPPKE